MAIDLGDGRFGTFRTSPAGHHPAMMTKQRVTVLMLFGGMTAAWLIAWKV